MAIMTGSVVSIRQVSSLHPASLLRVCACILPLFVWRESVSCGFFCKEKLIYIFCVLLVFFTYCGYISQVI